MMRTSLQRRIQYSGFINALSLKLESVFWLVVVRSRVLMILFFPVFVLLFLFGWVLYVAGDRQTSGKTASRKKAGAHGLENELISNEEGLEVGVFEEVEEEQFAN